MCLALDVGFADVTTASVFGINTRVGSIYLRSINNIMNVNEQVGTNTAIARHDVADAFIFHSGEISNSL